MARKTRVCGDTWSRDWLQDWCGWSSLEEMLQIRQTAIATSDGGQQQHLAATNGDNENNDKEDKDQSNGINPL